MNLIILIAVFPIVFVVVMVKTISEQQKENKQNVEKYGKTKYRDVFLTESEVDRLLNESVVPSVTDSPIYIDPNEKAVYYCKAIRVVRNSFLLGELIVTNQRVVFDGIDHPFDIKLKRINSVSFAKMSSFGVMNRSRYNSGLVINCSNTSYRVLLPHPSSAEKIISIMIDSAKSVMSRETYNEKQVDLTSDQVDGRGFEFYCADLLENNGFSEVVVTRGSNDQGADVLAVKEGIRYAIQCKNYSSSVGNKAVQEVNAAKSFYNCHVGVVMTNSTFTHSAIELANKTGVLLWAGDVIERMK